jgi:hypothetical protein
MGVKIGRDPDLPSLRLLMDDLVAVGVPSETIRVVAAAVRQAVTDARKKTHGPAPTDPRGFFTRKKGGA